ncbi:Glutamate receptor [Abeliophyllum distichum]|uniref:Glutamate receptor n=1 Tax=Abeliophyllum distichum TaxID=126358 RepID=A0ABD1NP71_9LAMI
MANTSYINQSHGSNSNSTIQAPVLMNNLTSFSMNLTQAASVKPDRDNFLLWKNVIMPIVRGHGLEGYLLGMKRIRKRSMSMDQYLSTIKQLAGKKIDHADLVTQVLAGLDEEYTPIIVQVNCRDQVSWHELSSTLMTFEIRL